ncbi:hypothetical protein WICMUC_000378 [Wickerhamomyces mucosus]|uniref:Major facilitator superfamily (MFS) profile domain-containing protein n=1 Tax=Wickerhamomyces mucosus TaxID=1378264 RepID=A0A9P8TIQ9_9ASCO|nr:hypothetical protein WICMUC_000378 [Wickerhamomyces mucosus]
MFFFYQSMKVSKYLKTRFTTLFLSKQELKNSINLINPFPILKQLNWLQWQYFMIGFLAWSFDAFDYFAVSINVSRLALEFNKSITDITWAMTLVLMLRSIGSILIGYFADRYGRKWSLIGNLLILTILQIGIGFVQNFKQFLAIRAIFGIVMGGMFGVASATSLESSPKISRSILSGIFQQGYAFGYLLVIAFQRAFDQTSKTWRALFWFSSLPPSLIIIWRLLLPENEAFIEQKLHFKTQNASFGKDFIKIFKKYWLKMLYMIILMTGISFMSHGSQDLYPTLLTKQLNFSNDESTITNTIANLGAIIGGILFGHFSGLLGRRFAITICCIFGGCLIYPWAFSFKNVGINVSVFFLQFFVQGALGIIPIHLSELSPPEFKVFVSGTAYQLGNLAASASSTIESKIGEKYPLNSRLHEEGVYNYAKVMSIFMGCVFGFILIVIILGPENRNGEINFKLTNDELLELQEEGILRTINHEEEINVVIINNDKILNHDDKYKLEHCENS